jgi:sugar phosphate isomerase/epimerase
MKHKLSLGYLMLPGVTPPELVRIAAEVGCGGVSLSAALSSMVAGQSSLLDDRTLRDETRRALRDFRVSLDLVEGVSVAPDTDLVRARSAIEVMRELGARRFNLSIWEPDSARASDLMSGSLRSAPNSR